MMKNSVKTIKLFISFSLACLCACSNSPNKRQSANVGIAVYDESDAFLSSWVQQYIEDADKYNLNITTAGARRSQLSENQLVKDMIADGADILCVNLVDRTSTSEIIKEAENANIPLIFFNREPVESDLSRWNELYYVGADAAQSGRFQGEIAISYLKGHPEADLNGDGMIQYYVLEGEPSHQDTIIRSESSVEALQTAGVNLQKEGYSICNWNRSEADDAVSGLINKDENIELLLCNNDEMAAGAVQAYDDHHIEMEKRPVILGIDGTKTGLEMVKSGKMAGTVYNDYIKQADTMLDLTIRLLQDKTRVDNNVEDRRFYLPYQKVTVENVDTYLQQLS